MHQQSLLLLCLLLVLAGTAVPEAAAAADDGDSGSLPASPGSSVLVTSAQGLAYALLNATAQEIRIVGDVRCVCGCVAGRGEMRAPAQARARAVRAGTHIPSTVPHTPLPAPSASHHTHTQPVAGAGLGGREDHAHEGHYFGGGRRHPGPWPAGARALEVGMVWGWGGLPAPTPCSAWGALCKGWGAGRSQLADGGRCAGNKSHPRRACSAAQS